MSVTPTQCGSLLAALSLCVGLSACESLVSIENFLLGREGTNQNTPDSTATQASPEKQLFDSDLAPACNGVPVAQTAAYDPAVEEIHPISVFARDDVSKSFSHRSDRVPDAWKVPQGAIAQTQLVACLTVTERKQVKECPFEDDGQTKVLEIYDTNYDVAIHETQTGRLVADGRFELKADEDCPSFNFFLGDKTVEQRDVRFDQALLEFAKPHVQTFQ